MQTHTNRRTQLRTKPTKVHDLLHSSQLVRIHNLGIWNILISISALLTNTGTCQGLWKNIVFAKPTPMKILQIPSANEIPINMHGDKQE